MTAASTRFLDPRALARISRLDLIARAVVDGFVAGLHQSPHLGVSTDFAEHRPYMPGDDTRSIDWRLWGRTDRLYVKEFEAETNADVMLLIDVSASMDFASNYGASNYGASNYGASNYGASNYGASDTGMSEADALTKLDYARTLAACLAYFSYQQRDRVGLVTFDSRILTQVRATGRRLDTILHTLERIQPGAAGELQAPLSQIATALRRRSILIMISDLYDDPEIVRRATGHLTLRGHDLIIFHLLDRQELIFDYDQPRQFEDAETGRQIPVIPERIRDGYRSQVKRHVAELARLLGESRSDYCQVDTHRPLDHALYDYLSRRQRLQRVR